MRILWFEVTTPGNYHNNCAVLGGWQDSLERIVRTVSDIELTIAFEDSSHQGVKVIDGVKYIPIELNYSNKELKQSKRTWEIYARKLVQKIKIIVDDVRPDLIQVFGTEWPFGLIAEYTDIPVVIHIQGSIAPFNNALLPPRYSIFDIVRNVGFRRFWKMKSAWRDIQKVYSRDDLERRIWKAVPNYMGRTEWDKGLSAVMHPGRRYYHVEEALRNAFTQNDFIWEHHPRGKIKLLSIGSVSFRKGPDMMLKTAHILHSLGIDFEWNVAGALPFETRQIVERKEKLSFHDSHIFFHGFVSGDKVMKMLKEATIFVHTAYAENSPNSICEAQCLGVPVVSTNVGGISSLVRDKVDGVLVPANDPWMMAYHISVLATDAESLKTYSINSRQRALERHSDEHIKKQLLDCYYTLLNR